MQKRVFQLYLIKLTYYSFQDACQSTIKKKLGGIGMKIVTGQWIQVVIAKNIQTGSSGVAARLLAMNLGAKHANIPLAANDSVHEVFTVL